MCIIGTVRPEEARIHDTHEGYHSFHAPETQEPFGSFEVFWEDGAIYEDGERIAQVNAEGEEISRGWYWHACFPGCLPDGDPSGPFATSRDAREDADEWAPEFDE